VEQELRRLLPDGPDGPVALLAGAEKQEIIERLKAYRPKLSSPACVLELSFGLALLGSDYHVNRDTLAGSLRACGDLRFKCDENSAVYMVTLYRNGHRELLGPLIQAGVRSDGALSEVLGLFYQKVLLEDPRSFIREIERFPTPIQRRECFDAGTGDGSGTSSADAKRVAESLKALDGPVGRVCASSFQDGIANSH
jgi:hypothetical protein